MSFHRSRAAIEPKILTAEALSYMKIRRLRLM
jgi:hypothetical protein